MMFGGLNRKNITIILLSLLCNPTTDNWKHYTKLRFLGSVCLKDVPAILTVYETIVIVVVFNLCSPKSFWKGAANRNQTLTD